MSSKYNSGLTPNEPACPSNIKFHNDRKEIFDDIYNMLDVDNADNNRILKTLQKKWGISKKHARVLLNDAMSESGYHQYFGSDATIILNAFKEVVKQTGCSMETAWSFYTSLKHTTIKDYTIGRQQIPVPLQNNFYDYMNIKLTDGQLVQKNLIPSKPYEPCENCIHKGTGNCAICLVTQYKLKQKLNMCRTTLNPNDNQNDKQVDNIKNYTEFDALVTENLYLRQKLEEAVEHSKSKKVTVGYLPKFVGIPINGNSYRVIQKQGIRQFITDSIKIEYRPVVKSDRDCMGRTVFETFKEAEETLERYRNTGKWKLR